MRVDAHVSSSACHLFSLLIRDVQPSALVPKLLAKTEIDNIYHIRLFPKSAYEIFRFDVSEDKIVLVQVFDSAELALQNYNLVCYHNDRFQRKFFTAEVEHVLQRRAETFHDDDACAVFFSEPNQLGES